ncbi:MAG: M3 family metallopeptidase [Trueperaceae bacterium]
MNPLLSREFRIPFHAIKPQDVDTGIREALGQAEAELAELLAFTGQRTYANTLQALDDLTEKLGRSVRMASHLMSVANSPELRTAYNAVLPEFSAFFAKLSLNEGVWQALKMFAESPEAKTLRAVRKRHLKKTLKEFIRAGAELPAEKKARVEAINVELSELQNKFSNNVLDATNAFELVLSDEKDLSGLPESLRQQAKADATAKGKEGYRFTLQIPFYQPFMQYADSRALRQKMYEAYVNRAMSGDTDNRDLIVTILKLRQELATLLGYKDFADYRLEIHMVDSGDKALKFEKDLEQTTLPYWHKEMSELKTFAKEQLGLETLHPWDVPYSVEKLRLAKYDLDDEMLRPYFPLDNVLAGMFDIVKRLFGITVTEQKNENVWHPDVKFYDIHDERNSYLGSFYADWFPREPKRGGAWMNSFITGGPQEDGSFAPHLGLICANFTPPQSDKPALLTHREVETTFHEFGHLLHHCLSRVEIADRAGTNVAWDFVELPSQIMENWTWEREALNLFARHYQTREMIPDNLYQKMMAAKTFMGANSQMRQLSFGTVDLNLHTQYQPERDGDVIAFGNRIMERFVLEPHFAHNGFLAGFTHIFAGGYAASYYSYKWSEVLEADAFSRFKREGIFNRQTGQAYVDSILSRGDSADPSELFREFMGRDPDVNALNERNFGVS